MKNNTGKFPALLDLILVSSLILLTIGYTFTQINLSNLPHEDAAILMRYSKHLARGYGIVWNIGEKPVDGATDFLFMVALAGIHKTGLQLESAVQILNLASHVVTVVLIYLSTRKYYGDRWVSFISAAYLALGPGLRYAEAYFGTPFFALFASLTFYFALELSRNEVSPGGSIKFSFSSLFLGLTRPEGVFLAILILLSILYKQGFRNSKRVVRDFVLIFACFGGIYFVWRWIYFGYPFPNPYYKKGGGALYFDSLQASTDNTVQLIYPFLILFLFTLLVSAITTISKAWTFKSNDGSSNPTQIRSLLRFSVKEYYPLIPIVGFTWIWILLSDEMNYLGRFQYPILPLVLMSWPAFVDVNLLHRINLGKPGKLAGKLRFFPVVLYLLISLAILLHPIRTYGNRSTYGDGRYDVAKMLLQYSDRHYTIATTEAGLIPLYSEWRAIDTWGLNDQWIAHAGQITETYLQINHPEIIMFHDYPLLSSEQRNADPWFPMVDVLKDYAEKNGYVLAAVYGANPGNVHSYYVRPDFPDSEDIITKIRALEYIWFRNGKSSTNFAVTE